MCNRFNIQATPTQLTLDLQAMQVGDLHFEDEVFPKGLAPTLILNEASQRELHAGRFGLIPWGKSPDTQRFPNNNARVENVGSWPWKGPFTRRRCVLPLSRFQEPCYWGETAGKEVAFSAPEERYLYVAGVYELYEGPQGSSVSMAFLMRPACEFVMAHGHHRQPFFISPEHLDRWMKPGQTGIEDAKEILRDAAFEPQLAYDVVREMAPSWSQRKKKRIADRDKQIEAVEALGTLGF